MKPPCLRALVSTASLLVVGFAAADPTPEDRVEARTLFDEGRAALRSSDYQTACPKLERSQRLDPGIGTLFNLASCYEGEGRFASAWTSFLEVAEAAEKAGQTERATVARDRARLVEPRLAHLRMTILGADMQTLTLDGAPFAAELLGTSVPIDPGGHELGADAPGKQHWAKHVDATESTSVEVSVPVLEDVPLAIVPIVETPGPMPPRVESVVPTRATPPKPSWRAPIAIVAAAVGAVGIGVGAGLGVLTIDKWSDARSLGCAQGASGQTNCPSGGAYQAWSTAHTAGIGSTVSFIAGGALVAAGAVVWFTRPKGTTSVGVRSDGVVVVGGILP